MKATAVLGGLLVSGALWAVPAAGQDQEQSRPNPFQSCEFWADEDLKVCLADAAADQQSCQQQHVHDVQVCRDLDTMREHRRQLREQRAKQQG